MKLKIQQFGYDGEKLYDIASMIRQRRKGRFLDKDLPDPYSANARKAVEEFQKYKNKNYEVTVLKEGKPTVTKMSAKDVVNEMRRMIDEHVRADNIYINGDPTHIARIVVRTTNGMIDTGSTINRYLKHLSSSVEMPNIGMNTMDELLHQMALEEMSSDMAYEATGKKSRYVKDVPNAEARSRMIESIKHSKINQSGWMNFVPIQPPLNMGEEYPHNNFEWKDVKAYKIRKYLATRERDPLYNAEMQGIDDNSFIEKLLDPASHMTQNAYEMFDGSISDYKYKQDQLQRGFSSNLFLKPEEDLIHNWDVSPDALSTNGRHLINGYINKMIAAAHVRIINSFERNRGMGEFTPEWSNFMRAYSRQTIGYPSIFPKSWMDDPKMKIKNNPFLWLTDQYYIDLARKAGIKSFAGKSLFELNYKGTPITNIEFDEKLKERLKASGDMPQWYYDAQAKDLAAETYRYDQRVSRMLARFSNLEGKFNMITLLSHTKTMVNNLATAHMFTEISTGFNPWKIAGNLQKIKDLVGYYPRADEKGRMKWDKIAGWDDVEKLVSAMGGIEAFITSEAALSGRFTTERSREVLSNVVNMIKKNPKADYKEIYEEVKKLGIGPAALAVGSLPMAYTERKARMRAWLSHYMQAKQVLEFGGAAQGDYEPNHPWLVQMANRGVEATQFLYTNASRPMFAATSMGRVFTRFQMWTWNSVWFNRELSKQANEMNFHPGTPEMERFKRLMTANLFTLGLATLFPASVFGALLAAPWSMFQDMAEFFFGNKKEREGAFWGELPYPMNIFQMVTPPSARASIACI